MKQIRFHPEATAELDAAMAWYNVQQSGLGLELHTAVQQVLSRLAANANAETASEEASAMFALTKRFPYAVHWLELEDAIWILAVAHTRRRPNYWKNRHPGK